MNLNEFTSEKQTRTYAYVYTTKTHNMQYTEQLSDLDAHYDERRSLQARNGRLHAEIWKLEGSDCASIGQLRAEINSNSIRVRTLNYLIDRVRLKQLGHL